MQLTGSLWFFRHKERVRLALFDGENEQAHVTALDEPGTINPAASLIAAQVV